MKPRTGPVEQSTKHQLKYLVQELKRPGESVAELYIRALKELKSIEDAYQLSKETNFIPK